MELSELKDRLLELLSANPHIPEKVKKEVTKAVPGLDKAAVEELIMLMMELNEQLVLEYAKMAEDLLELAKEAEKVAEVESRSSESDEIDDIRDKLGLD